VPKANADSGSLVSAVFLVKDVKSSI